MPVVVTGTGAVSALGGDVEATWNGVVDGRSAVRHWADLAAEGHALDVACRVDDAVWGGAVPAVRVRGRALARRAAREALEDAGLLGRDGRLAAGVDPARVGVFVGTTMGESGVYEDADATGEFDLAEGGSQVFASSVADTFGISGPCRTLGTACAAGNYAIGAAARAVASGRVDIAVAGGVEPFSRIAMVGFARMRAMAPDGCAPFGLGRRGMTLGEGAGFVVLQRAVDTWAARAVVGASASAPTPTTRPLRARTAAAWPPRCARRSRHPTWPPRTSGGSAPTAPAPRARTRPSRWPCTPSSATPRRRCRASRGPSATRSGRRPRSRPSSRSGRSRCARSCRTPVSREVDPALDVDVVLTARELPELDWVLSCGYAFGGLNSALVLGRAA